MDVRPATRNYVLGGKRDNKRIECQRFDQHQTENQRKADSCAGCRDCEPSLRWLRQRLCPAPVRRDPTRVPCRARLPPVASWWFQPCRPGSVQRSGWPAGTGSRTAESSFIVTSFSLYEIGPQEVVDGVPWETAALTLARSRHKCRINARAKQRCSHKSSSAA